MLFDDNASRVVAVVLGAFVLFGLGFVIVQRTIEEPTNPALDLAQSAGVAIPEEQEAAFYDGVVTTEEVREAADRFETCAIDAGAQGFSIEVSEFGWEVTVNEHSQALSECEPRHFRTTALIWTLQREPNGEIAPFVTTSLP